MFKNSLYIPFLLILLPSCFVAKDYQQPSDVIDESYYRTDLLSEDSVTMADYSWREVFTDPTLAAYIEEGLAANIDIRTALQKVLAAQAYYKQGKWGQLPTLSGTGQATHQELSKNYPI